MNVPFLYWVHEEPYDYYRYTEFALRRFAKASRLRVVVMRQMGGAPEVLADVFAKSIQFVPLLGRALAASAQAITGACVRTRWGRELSEETGSKLPLGYFMVAEKVTD